MHHVILIIFSLVVPCPTSSDIGDDTCVLQNALMVSGSSEQKLTTDEQVATASAQKELLIAEAGQHIWAYGVQPSDVLNTSFLETFVREIDIELYNQTGTKPVRNKLVFAMLQLLVLPSLCGVDRCFMGQTALGVAKALTAGGFGLWAGFDSFICLLNSLKGEKEIDFFGFRAEWEESSIKPAFCIYIAIFGMLAVICCCTFCCSPFIVGAIAFPRIRGLFDPSVEELEPSVCGGTMVGGIGSAQDLDDATKTIAESFRAEALSKAQADGWNGIFTKFEPVQAKTQVVARTDYFVKVLVSDSKAIHLRILKPLPHTGQPPSLVSVKVDQDPAAEVEYF
jgi:cystatin-A/B|mmetsp:Transcript_30131/g.48593  ORF Transcript_30131/g.48593 Transcript_30131/m.48593 type:complete len:338 (+) Transcript_30131:42-1055(+)